MPSPPERRWGKVESDRHRERQRPHREALRRELMEVGCLLGSLLLTVPLVLLWILFCLSRHWTP